MLRGNTPLDDACDRSKMFACLKLHRSTSTLRCSNSMTSSGCRTPTVAARHCRRPTTTSMSVVFVIVCALIQSTDGRRALPRVSAGSIGVASGNTGSVALPVLHPSSSSSSSASSSAVNAYQPPMPLAVWIDERQIERLIGVPMDIYIIRNGAIVPYLKDGMRRNAQLPVLPPDVARIEVTWMAEDDVYTYKFTELKSLDPTVLYDPLINITLKGTVPKTRSSFHVSFPCTMNATAVASLNIVLHLHSSSGQRVIGSPLSFSLRKRCEAASSFASVKRHRKSCRCHHGGHCDAIGRCQCPPGYHGAKCEFATCRITCQNGGTCVDRHTCQCPPGVYGDLCQHKNGVCQVPCKNGGTCTSLNTCSCPDGYTGLFCQKPICRRWCGVHGKCVGDNFCQCYRGWRGKMCNRTTNRPYEEQETMETRLKRRKRVHGSNSQKRRRRTSDKLSTTVIFESTTVGQPNLN